MEVNTDKELYLHTLSDLLLKRLITQLPDSTAADRRAWAKEISEQEIDLYQLSVLLNESKTIGTRFLWLLSDIGELAPAKLAHILPYLLNYSKGYTELNFPHSLCRYWLLAGVPVENEVEVIALLLAWVSHPKSNVMLKSDSMLILVNLCKKYPELINEVQLVLEKELEHYQGSFNARAQIALGTLLRLDTEV